ncbi:alkaline phosphatase family protein [Bacillus sp. T33-2]|uniref:alkaline phosphatase family protein n=1 Tax=Bacillus sp. T33-2 TaxID=2054168 RepID=UPI000C77F7DC|nr:alkaline phosphatase family protein [Bacillus sp. T33-2]PLR98751.1 phosphodiesterase [Bacillus sp. T33-2]
MAFYHTKTKPVILVLVDTLMTRPLQTTIEQGQATAFEYFIQNGKLYPEIVSPFPTMSVNIDSTLLTGVYCDKHKIPGLVWFKQDEMRLVNYGSHYRELIKLGVNQSVKDIFHNLNNVHLSREVSTIHEDLHKEGKKTASLNALIYRGSVRHHLKMPFLLSTFTDIGKTVEVSSPHLFSYGALSKINPRNRSAWRKYGFHNIFTVNELGYLVQKGLLPDFSIVYLSELDKSVHKNGEMDTNGIRTSDQHLGKILDSFASWEEALKNNVWIIMGDNGQTWIGEHKKEALLDLRKTLDAYKIVKLRQGVQAGDEIVLAVNERMAFVYSLNVVKLALPTIANTLKGDHKIDIIAWREGKDIHVISTEKDGKLVFRQEGNYSDEYGQTWSLKGNTEILDLHIDGQRITFDEYPDALARLNSAFFSHQGDFVIISAKPGYEIIGEGSPTHVGGASHGALNKQDSMVSMIVTGTDTAPKHLRLLDMKEWILSLIK